MKVDSYHIYAKKKDSGEIVSVNDVDNGLECNCVCTKCDSVLVAKANKKDILYKKESHFAHYKITECNGESLEHIRAKEIIKSNKYLWIPTLEKNVKVDFDEVRVEELIENSKYRADLICIKNNKKVVIEIVVTHDMEEEKINYLQNKNIPTLSIYLNRVLSNGEFSEKRFSEYVLKESKKQWVVNSKLSKKESDNINNQLSKELSNSDLVDSKQELEIIKHSTSSMDYEINKIYLKYGKRLFYGTLIIEDIRKLGGRGKVLCVKSEILSNKWNNLGFISSYQANKYRNFLGAKVGFILFFEGDHFESPELKIPVCEIKWCEKTLSEEIENFL